MSAALPCAYRRSLALGHEHFHPSPQLPGSRRSGHPCLHRRGPCAAPAGSPARCGSPPRRDGGGAAPDSRRRQASPRERSRPTHLVRRSRARLRDRPARIWRPNGSALAVISSTSVGVRLRRITSSTQRWASATVGEAASKATTGRARRVRCPRRVAGPSAAPVAAVAPPPRQARGSRHRSGCPPSTGPPRRPAGSRRLPPRG